MNMKACGRSALMLTGFLICLAAPSQAAPGSDGTSAGAKPEASAATSAKHGSRHWKKYARHKTSKTASKAPTSESSDSAKPPTNDAAVDNAVQSPTSSALPPSVANANAQLASADANAGNADAMSARASNILQTQSDTAAKTSPASESQIVASDQLNDLDRALAESKPADSKPATLQVAMVSSDTPAAAAAPINDSSSLDRTSLIGKIFIGFGALLTMASAARMFMA